MTSTIKKTSKTSNPPKVQVCMKKRLCEDKPAWRQIVLCRTTHGTGHIPLCGIFDLETRNLLYRLRTRTISGVRADFKGIYSDISCPLGCGEQDTLENILSCKVILSIFKSTSVCHDKINYNDIFSKNVTKQQEVSEIYRKFMEIRCERISQPVARLVPCIV